MLEVGACRTGCQYSCHLLSSRRSSEKSSARAENPEGISSINLDPITSDQLQVTSGNQDPGRRQTMGAAIAEDARRNNMTYAESIQFLCSLRKFGAKFGLANTHKLAALAGNPHQQLRFLHVAGTNGKGSTCAMLEGIYRAAGLRVGLFTSPHLVSFGERIQVNRKLISKGDITHLVSQMRTLLEREWDPEPRYAEHGQ